jgi:hypothetical protein
MLYNTSGKEGVELNRLINSGQYVNELSNTPTAFT